MATVPNPHSWAVGETVTAANLNSSLRDATNFLLGGSTNRRPTFRVYRAAVQSIATSVETQILWDTVSGDTDSGYSTGTGIYTVKTSGLWLFQVSTSWASNTTGNRGVHLNANGSDAWQWMPASVDGIGRQSANLIVNVAATQTVSSTVFQSSGGALNFVSGSTNFAGVWLSN